MIVRQTLKWAGIDIEKDVRFTNAVRHNPGKFPADARGAELLRAYAAELDTEIAAMTNLQVIVACGGPAMTRLLGRRSETGHSWGIKDWRGWSFRNADLPEIYRWHPKAQGWMCKMPENIIIIPTLHPAGIMRSKGRDEIAVFRRDAMKVVAHLNNTASKVEFHTHFNPTPTLLMKAFEAAHDTDEIQRSLASHDTAETLDLSASHNQPETQADSAFVYFDTEYDRDTKQIFWLGLSFDGTNIFGFPWAPQYHAVVTKIMGSRILKCAHNIHADVEALQKSGVAIINGPWYDTMIGMHTLHPALEVGLDDTARFYIDDVQHWKGMDHHDPYYNALDVAIGAMCMKEQCKEAQIRPVNPKDELASRMTLLQTTYNMRKRGMHVDLAMQRRLLSEAQLRIASLNEGISDAVKPRWDKRVRAAMENEYALEQAYQKYRTRNHGHCTKHKTFNGLRSPAPSCEVCVELYEASRLLRSNYTILKKRRAKIKTEVKRWQEGFVPTNNEHLRWLLYDPTALKLPVQRDPISRRITANRAAIDKLSTIAVVRSRSSVFKIVLDIKQVQQLEKAISTFINVPVDDDGIAHPTYKVHVARTGRIAGGADKSDERSDNRYSFNALNIPREWRRMYVPPTGHVLVEADWSNVEGRLTAHFSRDRKYQDALDGELKGGHKVHALNAGIIYGIDPADAKTVQVTLSGLERSAYDGGKRLTHAWSYGMQPPHMAKSFNISTKEAVRIDVALSMAYPQLVVWRRKLVDDVLGVWENRDGRNICTQSGRRFLSNPFGWQFHFLGVGAAQANEVIAFLPQSTGAGMWTRCAPMLERVFPIFTGTYDSFYLVVHNTVLQISKAKTLLRTVMERVWPEIGDRSFPIEISIGKNMGAYHEDTNLYGLKTIA